MWSRTLSFFLWAAAHPSAAVLLKQMLFCYIGICSFGCSVSVLGYEVCDTTVGIEETTGNIDGTTKVYLENTIYRARGPEAGELTTLNLNVTTCSCTAEEGTTCTAVCLSIELTIVNSEGGTYICKVTSCGLLNDVLKLTAINGNR